MLITGFAIGSQVILNIVVLWPYFGCWLNSMIRQVYTNLIYYNNVLKQEELYMNKICGKLIFTMRCSLSQETKTKWYGQKFWFQVNFSVP